LLITRYKYSLLAYYVLAHLNIGEITGADKGVDPLYIGAILQTPRSG